MANQKKVIGVERVSYTNKDNQLVTGVRISVATPLPPNSGTGYSVTSEFINGAVYEDYHCGPVVAVLYEPTPSGRARCTGVIYSECPDPDESGKKDK